VKDLITYTAESIFDQRYSEGFSRIWSLEVKLQKFMRGAGRRGR
jgi:hypothetical protein